MLNLSQFLPAMEAEDITDMASAGVDKAVGRKSQAPRDYMKTDNIFGTDKDDNSDADDTSDDATNDGSEEINDNNDVNDDDNPPDDSTDDNDDTSSESDDDLSDEDTPEEPNENTNKARLMQNMIMLYNIIKNSIDLLSNYTSQVSTTDNSTQILYNISAELSESKEILFKEITENFSKKDYVSLLKTYVGINRIYDLCTEMLNTHFDNLELMNKSKSKLRKKHKVKQSKPNKKSS